MYKRQDLEPRERRQMMRRIKNMEYQYIVGTDIAARGIDIDGASHIINREFPTELDFYIHRSGPVSYTHLLKVYHQLMFRQHQKIYYSCS